MSGRAAGRVSGRVRRRLNTERVTKELGDLETHRDAARWLRTLVVWGAGGKMPGSVLLACVQAVRTWKDLLEAETTFEVVEALRDDVRKLREDRDKLAQELEIARLGCRE